MKTNNTLRTAIPTALFATATGAQALPAETTTLAMSGTPKVNQKADTVYLMIKRESLKAEGWPWERVEVKASEAEETIKELLEDPDVLIVEKDTKMHTQQSSSTEIDLDRYYNDEGYAEQRIFKDASGTKMRLIEGLQRIQSDRTMRIGVLDGGFEVSNDIEYQEGYNFVTWETPSIPYGPAFQNGDSGICDGRDFVSTHGAGVTSIAAAKTNNYIGIAGVAPNTEVVAGRVANCTGNAFSSEIAEGILWLTGYGSSSNGTHPIEPVEVINISLGGEGACPVMVQEAINEAISRNITVVVSAGNELTNADDINPANCDGVITVAATNHDGELWEDLEWNEGSNTGSVVDIAATGEWVRMLAENDRISIGTGTSMASPLVAGAIAAVKRDRPNMTPADFERALQHSGNPLTVETTHYGIGGGVLDLMKLMDEAGIPRAQVPVNHALTGERERFAAALLHPKAVQYVADTGTISDNLCNLTEVDGRDLNPDNESTPISLFRVAKGSPLTPADPSATIIDQLDASQNRGIIELGATLDTSAYDYGIAQCDTTTGLGCNQKDTIRAVDPASLVTPAACEGRIVASRL